VLGWVTAAVVIGGCACEAPGVRLLTRPSPAYRLDNAALTLASITVTDTLV